LCDEFARAEKRAVVIHKENGGLSSARNAGMRVAKGEYITFLDSDDFLALDFVEKAVLLCDNLSAEISILDMDQMELQEVILKMQLYML
jgi:glycosyltransferase involved in cell wall biosynthesis